MAERVVLDPSHLTEIRHIDERLVSYDVEMAEVTGGTFWKPYTPEQIAGTEEVPEPDSSNMRNLMGVFPPVDLTNERLRKLAKEIGPAWVRVSGSWATDVYYDFDGHTNGTVPEGFRAILTKQMWTGVLDFVRAIGAKLMISVANCPGVHDGNGPWKPDQAKLIFDFSRDYGVPIEAAEFMNEPNITGVVGIPGYGAEQFARDHDIFTRWVRDNYPECKVVAFSANGDWIEEDGKVIGNSGSLDKMKKAGVDTYTSAEFLEYLKEVPDVFSYHCYNGVSERMPSMGKRWDSSETLTEDYLNVVPATARYYGRIRDGWCPQAPMWITESAGAGAGGDTWASTFMDVPRTINELGSFAQITDGVIFHNTLTSSDYGYLDQQTHLPRPSWWAVVLWNRIMGTTVYDPGEPIREGAHVYAHSRRDGQPGAAYAIVNNSTTENTVVQLPSDADVYTLSADTLRSPVMTLNGKELVLQEGDVVPDLAPVRVEAGEIELAPATVTFVVL